MEQLELRLVRVVLFAAAVLRKDSEFPVRSDHRVVVGQYGLDAVDARVRHLNTALPDVGDDALGYLHLDRTIAVGSAVFVRGLAAGR